MLGSLRLNGETACLVIAGATDALVFRTYLREVLAPTLQRGDIVICDNLAAHHDREAQQFLQSLGVELVFLPAYSPDLNPIELMWAKVKAHLRAAKARTEAQLLKAIQKALQSISATDAQGFFRHCGYMCTIH